MSTNDLKHKTMSVRMELPEFYALQDEADRVGVELSTYVRVSLKRARSMPFNEHGEGEGGPFKPDSEFGEYLATAMALMIVTGAHATDGLEPKVKEMTLEIMKSLGVA